jgi:hypothetical protein
MLNQIPDFDEFYVVYRKDDPAEEPIMIGDSSPAALAEASRKTGRPKQDFELRRTGRNEYETLKRFFD